MTLKAVDASEVEVGSNTLPTFRSPNICLVDPNKVAAVFAYNDGSNYPRVVVANYTP